MDPEGSPAGPVAARDHGGRLPPANLPAFDVPGDFEDSATVPSDVPGGKSSATTLAELEQIALANNPTLVQASMRVQAARGRCLQAGLYPNPTIGYHGEEMGNEGSAGQQGAFIGQEIVTAGKLDHRRNVAGHEVIEAEQALAAQRERILSDVRTTAYELIVAGRIVELNEQLVQIGESAVKAADQLLAAMEVSRVDLLQAQIEINSAKLQLRDAQNRHQAAWRRLTALLGVTEMEPVSLTNNLEDDLPELSWEDSRQHVLAESPEMAEARAGVQRAQCEVVRENAEWVPNLDVQAGVRYDDAASDTVATVEVGMPLPIFNRNQGNICAARARLIAAENEVRRVELALQDRLASVFKQYDSARRDAQQYAAEILPNAKASLDLVQIGYSKGEYDYLTLLTAQRTFYRVNLAYLESLLLEKSSRARIEGFLLTGGLDAGR